MKTLKNLLISINKRFDKAYDAFVAKHLTNFDCNEVIMQGKKQKNNLNNIQL